MWVYIALLTVTGGTLFAAVRMVRWSRTRHRVWRVAANLVRFCFFLLAAFALIETACRFFVDTTDAGMFTKIAEDWHKRHVKLNSQNFRDRERQLLPAADTYRIAVVGDSFAFGHGIDDPADRFSDRLEARFNNDAGRPVEVVNMSRGGWSTRDELVFLQSQGLAYRPKLVLLAYCINDVFGIDLDQPKYIWGNPAQPLKLLVDHFYSINFLYWQLRMQSVMKDIFDWIVDCWQNRKFLDIHRSDLESIEELCNANGAKLLIVILPVPAVPGFQKEAAIIHEAIRDVVDSRSLPYLDLDDQMRNIPYKEMRIHAWDPHFSVRAHHTAADIIYDHLVKNGYLEEVPSPGAD